MSESQRFRGRGAEGRRERPASNRCARRGAGGVEHRRLKTRERKLESLVEHGTREIEAPRITVARELLDRGTSGISKAEQRGNFVEGLTRRVVAGFAEQAIATPGRHIEQQRVATGHE